MISYDRSESARDNFSKFIYQFQPETKTRETWKNLNKIIETKCVYYLIKHASMKAFMDDVTLSAESRSHLEQLVNRLQGLFKWAAMKIKPSKCRSLSLLKGNCKEIKFSVSWNEIPTIREKSVKSLGRCYSLPLIDRHRWQDLRKLLQNGLRANDKCDLMNKYKIWCIYFGLIPKLTWPLQIYEVSLTKVETMEWLFKKMVGST